MQKKKIQKSKDYSNYFSKKNKKATNEKNLVLTKLSQSASDINVFGNQMSFGLPRLQQTIWPKQTARLNMGWQLTQVPSSSMIHTIPGKGLLNANLISIPQTLQQGFGAVGQLTQLILNNGEKPIKLFLDQENYPRMCQLDPITLQKIPSLKFDWQQLFHLTLFAAKQIIPIFL